jgi:poly-gamma-glutamate synthesis protein (capsule biosynthesis protein)
VILIIIGFAGAAGLLAVSGLLDKDRPAVTLNSDVSIKPTEKVTAVPTNTPLKEDLKIVAVGDILLGRGVESRLEKANRDFIYPFEKVADILKKGDVVFGNLEESITDSTKSLVGINQGGKYVLKNKVKAFDGIKYAGFNLLSLANNHILDYYEKGLFDTMDILDRNGIAYAGAGKNLEEARRPAIIEKNGFKIGLLCYTDMSEVLYKGNPPLMFIAGKNKAGVAPTKTEYIREDVAKVRSMVDILIVSFHWGKEESFEILPYQRRLAQSLMDSGVDIILGHHPHQFHGIEIYKGKPIVYSMGNFIFDQNDPENQESFILNLGYSNKKLVSFSAIPVRTVEKSQIVPQTGLSAASMINREVDLSMDLGSKCIITDNRIVFDVE